jgi:enoyl-CoA hydratase
MAKAKYHLMLCEAVSGEEAERIGLVSLAVDDDQLWPRPTKWPTSWPPAARAPSAGPSTRSTTGTARRAHDTSLALEFMGFGGPDVHEGVASLRERRAPRY